MAASNLNLGKASGGVLNIQPADGTTNTSLVLPASGTVVATDVAVTDNAIARYDGTTGKVQNSGVAIDDNGILLVGNTPSGLNTLGQLIVNQPSSGNVNLALTNKTNDAYSYIYNDGTALKIINSYNSTAGFKPIILQAGGSDRFTLDVNGNVGIGVTPSAWGSIKAIDLGGAGAISSSGTMSVSENSYYNGTNWFYKNSATATLFQQPAGTGSYMWYTAPSGTAGNAITWTTSMLLNSTGNLLVGTTTDNGVNNLKVNGSISSLSNLVADNFITGTFSAGLWYNTGITSNTVYADDFSTLFGINIFEDSFNTSNANYYNVHTFITGPYTNSTNSGNALPLSIVSRTGHACNGGTLSMRWLNQAGGVAVLQFSLSAGGTFDSTAGKTLRVKIKKIN